MRRPAPQFGKGAPRLEMLEPRLLLAGDLEISEFMAVNDSTLIDPADPTSTWDWIEIHNPTASTVNMGGWSLKDSGNTWSLPAVDLAAGAYFVVYASGKDGYIGGRYHTNFKLDGDGEYLGLWTAGAPVHEFAPAYPKQVADVSYGIGGAGLVSASLVYEGTTVRYLVPAGDIGDAWRGGSEPYDDSAWEYTARSVGFDLEGTFGPSIETDVEGVMYGQNATLCVRIPFAVADASDVQSLILRIWYDDGFVAYLNGTKVAEANAPASPVWNSAATAEHTDDEAVVGADFDISAFAAQLRSGSNILAIQGLNLAAGDNDFLLGATLTADVQVDAAPEYYTTPTRGQPNVSGSMGFVADTKFSIDRGFYDNPFSVVISCGTPGAEIRYTLDGSAPTATTGTKYTAPVSIATTTMLRAAAFKPGWQPSGVDTQTYIFLADVIHQTRPAGYPYQWVANTGATVVGDYEMDPDVVNPGGAHSYADTIIDALKAIPTLSVVMSKDDLFGPAGTGIYVTESEIEKPASLELIFPDAGPDTPEGFQVGGIIEIQGGSSDIRWKMYKLSMRVHFKSPPAGSGWDVDTKLEYPLFGEDGAQSFDTIILDAMMNNIWAYTGGVSPDTQRARGLYTRDLFVSNLQLALGGQAPRGRFVHLYLNGVYWGLYWIHERPDESFASAYLGGNKEDYYVLKHNGNTVVYPDPAKDAAGAAAAKADYAHMFADAAAGLYDHVMQEHLDVDAFIDYMLLNFMVGNTDWAHQNWYASRNHVDPDGRWRYYSWDAEHVLEDPNQNVTTKNDTSAKGPTALHQLLRNSAEYRMRFADHVQRAMSSGGVLTPEGAKEVMQALLDEIDLAIIAESARWGDVGRPDHPYTRDHEWIAEVNRIMGYWAGSPVAYYYVDGLLDTRTATTLGSSQLKATPNPLFPSGTDAPMLSSAVLVGQGSVLRVLVPTDNLDGFSWTGGAAFDDSAWTAGVTSVGYDTDGSLAPYITTNIQAQMYGLNASALIRIPFEVSDPADVYSLRLRMRYDDGFVVYLNGVKVASRNALAGSALTYNAAATVSRSDSQATVFEEIDISAYVGALRPGGNILAVHAFNRAAGDSDFLIAPELHAAMLTVAAGTPVALTKAAGTSGTVYYRLDGLDPRETGGAVRAGTLTYSGPFLPAADRDRVNLKARVLNGSTWSALTEVTLSVGQPALRITEIMYSPPAPSAAEIAAGFTDAQMFEYIEIRNIGARPVSLADLALTRGVDFRFPAADLAAGDYVLVVSNPAAFQFRYPDVPASKIIGKVRFQTRLDNAGETVRLEDARGTALIQFEYEDGWYGRTDGGGFSLVVRSDTQDAALWSQKEGWRPSWYQGGSPGAAEPAGAENPGAIVISEVLAHQDSPTGDWVELLNTTGHDIDIGGWYLSDDPLALTEYRFPDGTIVGAGQYRVFTAAAWFGSSIAFSEYGDEVILVSGYTYDPPGSPPPVQMVGGYREDEDFGASPNGVTFGRYVKSTGGVDFVLLAAATPDAANAYPLVGPVVISELMYNPAAGGDEYIELHNLTGSPVLLYDPAHPENTWQFQGGIGSQAEPWALPPGAVIPAYGYALVVQGNPETFRTKYGIPAEVSIWGPYGPAWALSNGGEAVALYRPGTPDGSYVPYILVDRVNYDDEPPWPATPPGEDPPPPTSPDGGGPSLERVIPSAYGNDVANWLASAAGGTPGALNTRGPGVASVALNARDGRGPGGIDPSTSGVRTIEIRFAEPVTFAEADVTVQAVTFPGGVEQVQATLTPTSITGSGTDTMTITLAAGAAVDTWVKVTLSGSGTLKNAMGRRLDGEAASGAFYIAAAAMDLPSGDTVPGGDAVFYVGSLRGDFNADRQVTAADKAGFADKWRAGDPDADFRGVGFGVRPPDGRVTLADIDGFTAIYQAAVAAGRRLDDLPPTYGGGAAANVTELPLLCLAGAAGSPASAEGAAALPPAGDDLLAAAVGQVIPAPPGAELHTSDSGTDEADTDDGLCLRQEPAASDAGADVMRI